MRNKKTAAKRPKKRAPKPPEEEGAGDGSCFECQKVCDKDQYCFGCRTFICEEHSLNLTLMGGHAREDHLEFRE